MMGQNRYHHKPISLFSIAIGTILLLLSSSSTGGNAQTISASNDNSVLAGTTTTTEGKRESEEGNQIESSSSRNIRRASTTADNNNTDKNNNNNRKLYDAEWQLQRRLKHNPNAQMGLEKACENIKQITGPGFRDNTLDKHYCFDDSFGMVGKAVRKEDMKTKSITMEAEFDVEEVYCYLILEGTHGKNPYGMMKCEGEMDKVTMAHLKGQMSELNRRADKICGTKYRQCPTKFVTGMMEYLTKHPNDWSGVDLPYFEGEIIIRQMDESEFVSLDAIEDLGEYEDDEGEEHNRHRHQRDLSHSCSDSWTGRDAMASPIDDEPNCPIRMSGSIPRSDGATCMCPYESDNLAWSYWSAHDPYNNDEITNLKWLRHYGGNYGDCPGRCVVPVVMMPIRKHF